MRGRACSSFQGSHSIPRWGRAPSAPICICPPTHRLFPVHTLTATLPQAIRSCECGSRATHRAQRTAATVHDVSHHMAQLSPTQTHPFTNAHAPTPPPPHRRFGHAHMNVSLIHVHASTSHEHIHSSVHNPHTPTTDHPSHRRYGHVSADPERPTGRSALQRLCTTLPTTTESSSWGPWRMWRRC